MSESERVHALQKFLLMIILLFTTTGTDSVALVARADTLHADRNFSGVWLPVLESKTIVPDPLPFNDRAGKLYEKFITEFTDDDDPGRFCFKPGMPRAIWGPPFAVEIFHTPQEITIFWEAYSMLRKIYLENQDPPEPLVPSYIGYSLAHWEGDTLIVETSNLLPYSNMRRLPTSSAARVTERIRIEERIENGIRRKYLVNNIVLNDPKVYTRPVHIMAELIHRPDLQVLEYNCTEVLWEEYLSKRGLSMPDLESTEAQD